MNKMLSVLGLALATTLTGTVVSANPGPGTIRFEGKITATTCPIEVDGSCGLVDGDPNTAKVTFIGNADSSGDYFAVTPTADGAKGVAIVIKDQTLTSIKPGSQSAPYALIEGGATDMVFNAYYRSTAATVQAGAASADVQFVVAIN
ncbi:pilus assembly protein [Pseudomonas syringae pv. syringae]|nr:pilus assembly protein [Pseudomonas syringae pv. syringae]